MNKQELITAVSTKTGLTKGETEKTVNALLKIVSDELVASGQISLNGLGTFVVVHRGAYPGRNPRTGEQISIPASKTVRLSPSKKLKDAVNG